MEQPPELAAGRGNTSNRFPIRNQLLTNNSGTGGLNLGQSEKNANQKSRALVVLKGICKKMQIKHLEDLDVSTDLTTEEEMIEYYRKVAVCLSGGVPKYCDENYESNSEHVLCWDSTKQLMSMVNTLMKEKYKNHPAFPARKGDNAEWYNQLTKVSMKKEFDRNFEKWKKDPDYKIGHDTVYPIYRDMVKHAENRDVDRLYCWNDLEEDSTAEEIEASLGQKIGQIWSMDYICSTLFNRMDITNKQSFFDWAILLMQWLGAGRPGEARSLRIDKWQFYPCVGLCDTPWTESKTIREYSMAQMMCKDDPRRCFFYMIFALFAGRCFQRTDEDIRNNRVNYLFVEMQKITPDSCTKQITKILESCLPKNAPSEIRNGTSGKSIRCGAVSTMAEQRNHAMSNFTLFDLCARSGHSTGSNVDIYNSMDSTLHASVKGGLILNGNESVPCTPYLETLPFKFKDSIEKMVSLLLENCDVPVLHKGGHLYHLTRTALATGLVWHNYIERHHTHKHPIVQFMRDLVVEANLQDEDHPTDHPLTVLQRISDIMITEHWNRNDTPTPSPTEGSPSSSSPRGIQRIGRDITEMREEDKLFQKNLCEQISQRFKGIEDELRGVRSSLCNENAELKDRCSQLEHKLALANMQLQRQQGTGRVLPSFATGSGSSGSPLELDESPLRALTQPRPAPWTHREDLPAPSNLFNLHQPQDCHVNAFSATSSINNSRIQHVHVHSSESRKVPRMANPYSKQKKRKSSQQNAFFIPRSIVSKDTNSQENKEPNLKKKKVSLDGLEDRNKKFSAEALGEVDPMLVCDIAKERRLTATTTRKPDKLIWTEKDSEKLLKKGNQGAIPFVEVLRSLHSARYFEGTSFIGRGYHISCTSAKWAFANVMELLQMIANENPDATQFLKEPQPGMAGEKEYSKKLNAVLKLMMDKLLHFDGRNDAEEQEITVSINGGPRQQLNGKKKPGRKISPTVAAMGTRIRNYKQEIQKAFPDLKVVKLCNRDEWEIAPGTPIDNHSLREFFVPRNNNNSTQTQSTQNSNSTQSRTSDSIESEYEWRNAEREI